MWFASLIFYFSIRSGAIVSSKSLAVSLVNPNFSLCLKYIFLFSFEDTLGTILILPIYLFQTLSYHFSTEIAIHNLPNLIFSKLQISNPLHTQKQKQAHHEHLLRDIRSSLLSSTTLFNEIYHIHIPFYIVTTACTVDLLIPYFFAALTHRCIVVYDISCNFHCPFLDITFHKNSPHSLLFYNLCRDVVMYVC